MGESSLLVINKGRKQRKSDIIKHNKLGSRSLLASPGSYSFIHSPGNQGSAHRKSLGKGQSKKGRGKHMCSRSQDSDHKRPVSLAWEKDQSG